MCIYGGYVFMWYGCCGRPRVCVGWGHRGMGMCRVWLCRWMGACLGLGDVGVWWEGIGGCIYTGCGCVRG